MSRGFPIRTPCVPPSDQGTNSYSLSHIARYVATLANRGNCYDLTLLDKLTETDGTLIQEYEPALHNQVQIADSSWNAVQQGMRLVAENTKSLNVLSDLGLNVAGQDRYGARARAIRTMRCLWALRPMRVRRLPSPSVSPTDIHPPTARRWARTCSNTTLILRMRRRL